MDGQNCVGLKYCQIFNQVSQGMGRNRKMGLWGRFLGVLWPAWAVGVSREQGDTACQMA